jgi:hypothetical protein
MLAAVQDGLLTAVVMQVHNAKVRHAYLTQQLDKMGLHLWSVHAIATARNNRASKAHNCCSVHLHIPPARRKKAA